MQDGVGLTPLHFLYEVTSFQRRLRNDLDSAPFCSAKTSPITGSAPWVPVPTMSPLPPQGIFSPAESGVWPKFSRNCLERPFLCFRTLPPSITTSWLYGFPST